MLAASGSLTPLLATAAPAPVIEAATRPGVPADALKALEERLARAERKLENQGLLDMEMRIESLQRENQELLGQLEEQGFELESLKKRQRELYLDIDRRLAALEAARLAAPVAVAPALSEAPVPAGDTVPPVATTTAPVDGPAVAPPAAAAVATGAAVAAGTSPGEVDPQEERQAYERAFNLLKEGRYDLAVAAFKTFVGKFPDGRYADNAQYWLGEANYVQRKFKQALSEFEKLVNDFPDSPKRPDALLKIGYTYQELGDNDKARLSLNNVRMNYPDTTAARLATKRLQDLKP